MIFKESVCVKATLVVLKISFVLVAVLSPFIPHSAVAQPSVTRYPYIQSTTTTSTIIAWKTDVPSDSAVEYGLTSNYGLAVTDAALLTSHALTLTGLSPNTLYHYRVKGGGLVLTSDEVFKTTPGPVNPVFSFVAFGDSGSGGPHMTGVANLVKSLNPDLLIHTGDLIYSSGEAANFDPNFFVPYKDVVKSKPFFGTMGNHDEKTDNGQPWLDAFYLPSNNPLGTERFYSFDYGNAHFIALEVINDVALSSAQLNWMVNDLQTTNQFWKFVFFHVPPYSNSLHGSALNVRASVSPVLEQYGVDMVFNGHDHDYERTLAVKDFFPGNKGVIYIVTGGGGDEIYASGTSSFTAYSESAQHVTHVQINGSILTLKAVREDGTIMDTLTVDRSTNSPIVDTTNTKAIPDVISIFGDNPAQTRSSPFGPGWTSVAVKTINAASVKANLGDFLSSILPVYARDRALNANAWDNLISFLNNTILDDHTNGLWTKTVVIESLFSQAAAHFSPAVFRRMVEQELRTGQKTITVTVSNASGATTSNVSFWVVDAQIMVRKGWNLRSTPMALADTKWGDILALGNKTSNIGVGLKFEPSRPAGSQWQILGASDTVAPLDGIYIYANQDDSIGARLFRSSGMAIQPATKSLTRGAWNLVSTAPDFTENFNVVTLSKMRGLLPIDVVLKSVGSEWVTAISPGEGDAVTTRTYTFTGITPGLTLGSYDWRFGQPGWSFTKGMDTVNPSFTASSKGWTVPFGGYWVFIVSARDGNTAPISLSGKNAGVLTDDWLLKLLTLSP